MATATWSARRGTGAEWFTTVTCPHATSSAMTFFLPVACTAEQVEAAAPPSKLYVAHVAKTGCDCALVVETPVP